MIAPQEMIEETPSISTGHPAYVSATSVPKIRRISILWKARFLSVYFDFNKTVNDLHYFLYDQYQFPIVGDIYLQGQYLLPMLSLLSQHVHENDMLTLNTDSFDMYQERQCGDIFKFISDDLETINSSIVKKNIVGSSIDEKTVDSSTTLTTLSPSTSSSGSINSDFKLDKNPRKHGKYYFITRLLPDLLQFDFLDADYKPHALNIKKRKIILRPVQSQAPPISNFTHDDQSTISSRNDEESAILQFAEESEEENDSLPTDSYWDLLVDGKSDSDGSQSAAGHCPVVAEEKPPVSNCSSEGLKEEL
jgi:hypothetical protein